MPALGLLYKGLTNGIDLKPNTTSTPSVPATKWDYKVIAHQSSNQTLAVAGAYEKLTDNWISDSDVLGSFSNGTYTVPATGYYHIVVTTEATGSALKTPMAQLVSKNSTLDQQGWCHQLLYPYTTDTSKMYGESIQYLTIGDTLDVQMRVGGSNQNVKCISFAANMIIDTSYIFNMGITEAQRVVVTTSTLTELNNTCTVKYDPAGACGASTFQWTVPATGNYYINVNTGIDSCRSGTYCYFKLLVDDTTEALRLHSAESTQGGVPMYLPCSTIYRFTAGEVVSMYVYHTSFTGTRYWRSPEFSGFRISA